MRSFMDVLGSADVHWLRPTVTCVISLVCVVEVSYFGDELTGSQNRRPEDSDYTVDVLTRCSVSKDCSGKKAMKIVPPKERGEPVVISLPLSQHSNYMPKDLLPVEARENTLRKVEEVLSRFAKDGVPLLDPEEDMKVQSKSFRKASRRIEALASLFEKHDIRSSLHIQQKLKVLHDKQELSAKMKSIKKTMQASTALAFKDELKAQKRVLRRLAYCILLSWAYDVKVRHRT
ncbi:hypothetical protein HU200_004208 [Digitaria exilis]|uniref:Exosome RNA helicase MTR4-like beta-barrel domain-containing protein n=1 Tax=Digitaria exilis TaxID=1010633 RepID=A0A835FSR5_9POAL|nr:hypothetical protein HU200_004208 [Digitaria exilis]